MDIEKLKLSGINYDEGLKRFMGKNALYEKYLLKFPDDVNFAGLEKALNENNTKDAFTYAHTLKGIVGNLSFDDFYKTLYDLVEELRAENMDKVPEHFEALKGKYEEIITALKEA